MAVAVLTVGREFEVDSNTAQIVVRSANQYCLFACANRIDMVALQGGKRRREGSVREESESSHIATGFNQF